MASNVDNALIQGKQQILSENKRGAQRSSCGALLRGTLGKCGIDDTRELTRRRKHLVKESIYDYSYGSCRPETYGYLKFKSIEDYTAFKKSMTNKEISLDSDARFKFCLATISTAAGKYKTKVKCMNIQRYKRHMFNSQIMYHVIPVVDFQFDTTKLELSDEAHANLKKFCSLIWKNYDNKKSGTTTSDDKRKAIYDECANFFERFGSHLNVSIFTLGGMLLWTSTFCAETDLNSTEIKYLVASGLYAHVQANVEPDSAGFGFGAGAAVSASRYNLEQKSKGGFDATDTGEVTLSYDIYGGSPASSTYLDWRQSLTSECSSLIIINNEDQHEKEYIGAWDILKQDPKVFKDDDCTGETNKWDKMNGEDRAELQRIASESMFENFKTWIYRKKIKIILNNAGKTPTSDEYIKGLHQIEIENKQLKNGDKEWLEFLQDDDQITQFLLKPPNLKFISKKKMAKIQTIIIQLLDAVGENDFLRKDDVLKVTKPSREIERCIEIREDIRSILKKAEKAKNNDHFRHSLKILAGLINQPESTYKREWIHMLSLDDGIESAILQKEPYMNMAAKKLEKTSKQLEQLLHIDMAIAPENERYNLLKLDLDLKINARRLFRENICGLAKEAGKTNNGSEFLNVLENMLKEVNKLKSAIGNIKDWLDFIDGQRLEVENIRRQQLMNNAATFSYTILESEYKSTPDLRSDPMNTPRSRSCTESNDQSSSYDTSCDAIGEMQTLRSASSTEPYDVCDMTFDRFMSDSSSDASSLLYRNQMPGIFVKPFHQYMYVSLETFKAIEETIKALLKSAPEIFKQTVEDQMGGSMYTRINIRNDIAYIRNKAMSTEDGKKYCESLEDIKKKVKELAKAGLQEEWEITVREDKSMKKFLDKANYLKKNRKEAFKLVTYLRSKGSVLGSDD